MRVRFNQANLKKMVADVAKKKSAEGAKEMERAIVRLGQQHKGKTVAEIKPILIREFASHGWRATSEAEVVRVSTAISNGERVPVEGLVKGL